MTAREKLKMEHPEDICDGCPGGVEQCPDDYGYLPAAEDCVCDEYGDRIADDERCTRCWAREIPEENVLNNVVLEPRLMRDKDGKLKILDVSLVATLTAEEIQKIGKGEPLDEKIEKLYEDLEEGKISINEARKRMGLSRVEDSMFIARKENLKVICISGKAQHGKDTTAGFMKEALEKRGKKVLIAHYGDLVKYVAKTFFDWDGNKDEKGRTILQYVGTDVIRAQAPNYWVEFIAEMLVFFRDRWDYVLIPDCRFPNEIEYLAKFGHDIINVRVIRPNFENPLTEEQRKHPSETALDDYGYDFRIWNDGDVNHLKNNIEAMVNAWLPGETKIVKRISKRNYYLKIAEAVSLRSTCIRRQYGAVIVKDDQIIATGYNGAARGEPNCCDIGECWREAHGIPHGQQYEKCVAVHAEDNAISQAGRAAIGATLYLAGFDKGKPITAKPCLMCERKIKNAGIVEVVCSEEESV